MGLVLTQSADTVVVPVGVTSGTILVTRPNVTFSGSDRDSCIVRGDGFGAYQALVNYSGPGIQSVTFENCTLDCNDLNDYVSVIQSNTNCPLVTLRNVKLMGVVRSGIHVYSDAAIHLSSIEIRGSGAGIQVHTAATSTYLKDITVYGGRAPFTLSDGTPGTVPGIKIYNFKAYNHFFQSPTSEEVTLTDISATSATVIEHVESDRSFADIVRLWYPVLNVEVGDYVAGIGNPFQPWDRIEGDGAWSYFDRLGKMVPWMAEGSWRPVPNPPTGNMNVWRLIIGRLGGYTDTVLDLRLMQGETNLWPNAHWRYIDGSPVPKYVYENEVTRIDILRHGLAPATQRDVDTGFHITDTALNPIVEDVYIEGGYSDDFTCRAAGAIIKRVKTKIGQDMGITADGTTGRQYWYDCEVDQSGVYGVYVIGDIDIIGLKVNYSGWHNDGQNGYGVVIESDANCVLDIAEAIGNRRSTTLGPYTEPPSSVAAYPSEYYKLRKLRGK